MSASISKLKYFLLCLVAFSLSCYIYSTSICIIIFSVVWVIEGDYKRKLNAIISNKYVWLFCGLYLLHVIGMIYTNNFDMGMFSLEKKLSLLVFPLMLVSEGEMDLKKQKQFMYPFIIGCLVNALICFGYAIWLYETEGKMYFTYIRMSLFLHPSYYSMYIDFVFVFIFYLFTDKATELSKKEKIFLISSLFFLEFMLVMLQSKTGLIIGVIVLAVCTARYVLRTKQIKQGLVMSACTVVMAVLLYSFVVNGYSRIASASNIVATQKLDNKSVESTQARYFVWQSAWALYKTSPLIGVGTGDTEDKLMGQYAKDSVLGALKEKLNTHDEYLQVMIAIGIGGLICLLACLVLPFYKCFKERRFVYAMFLIIVALNFLTESMLETQGGTIFYGLFNSLLMFNFVI
jgi:O-antigen ligase